MITKFEMDTAVRTGAKMVHLHLMGDGGGQCTLVLPIADGNSILNAALSLLGLTTAFPNGPGLTYLAGLEHLLLFTRSGAVVGQFDTGLTGHVSIDDTPGRVSELIETALGPKTMALVRGPATGNVVDTAEGKTYYLVLESHDGDDMLAVGIREEDCTVGGIDGILRPNGGLALDPDLDPDEERQFAVYALPDMLGDPLGPVLATGWVTRSLPENAEIVSSKPGGKLETWFKDLYEQKKADTAERFLAEAGAGDKPTKAAPHMGKTCYVVLQSKDCGDEVTFAIRRDDCTVDDIDEVLRQNGAISDLVADPDPDEEREFEVHAISDDPEHPLFEPVLAVGWVTRVCPTDDAELVLPDPGGPLEAWFDDLYAEITETKKDDAAAAAGAPSGESGEHEGKVGKVNVNEGAKKMSDCMKENDVRLSDIIVKVNGAEKAVKCFARTVQTYKGSGNGLADVKGRALITLTEGFAHDAALEHAKFNLVDLAGKVRSIEMTVPAVAGNEDKSVLEVVSVKEAKIKLYAETGVVHGQTAGLCTADVALKDAWTADDKQNAGVTDVFTSDAAGVQTVVNGAGALLDKNPQLNGVFSVRNAADGKAVIVRVVRLHEGIKASDTADKAVDSVAPAATK